MGVKTASEILVIDDEPQMRRLLVRVLTGASYVVRQAANGGHGIELFHRARLTLIITDIVMPDTERVETIRERRRASPTIPILAISGASDHPLYLRAAAALGATAVLEKPFRTDELLWTVAKLLSGASNPSASGLDS